MLVPPGEITALAEAIKRMYTDRELARRMGEEGRKFVQENYRWEVSLDKMIGVYEEVTGKA